MIFAVMGFFKPGVDTQPPALQPQWNEHLAQRSVHVRLAGALRNPRGERTGYMLLIETDGFEQAEAFLRNSPYLGAHLYERVEVGQYAIEAGKFD